MRFMIRNIEQEQHLKMINVGRAEYYLEVQEWEQIKQRAKNNQGKRDNFVVNSQRSNIQLAKTLGIGTQTASRIIQIHQKAPEELCPGCGSANVYKAGFNIIPHYQQRYRCRECKADWWTGKCHERDYASG